MLSLSVTFSLILSLIFFPFFSLSGRYARPAPPAPTQEEQDRMDIGATRVAQMSEIITHMKNPYLYCVMLHNHHEGSHSSMNLNNCTC